MEELEIFQRLGTAVAIGFLIGVERGWKARNVENESRVAGLRTYTLIGLLGGVSALLAIHLGALAFAAMAVIFGAAWGGFKFYEMLRDGDISVTGLIAGVLTFALGAYSILGNVHVAAASGVLIAAVLAFKQASHNWVKALTWPEIQSALLILAATLIALPLIPDRALDPYGAFNPRQLWLLTIVIAAAGFAGYLALRLLGERAGLFVGAAAGALVSSTIVTADLARRARSEEVAPLHAAAAATLASVVMFLRIGVFIAIFATAALRAAAPAVIAACLVALIATGALLLLASRRETASHKGTLGSPLDIKEVARFALLLSAITVGARIIAHVYGNAGVIAFAASAGLVDVDSVALAVGGLVHGGLDPHVGAEAILLAAAVNTLSKMAIGAVTGGRRFALAFGGASICALLAGAAAFLVAG